MQLPATAIHDISTANMTLQNTTAVPQTFEFGMPPGSDLTLSPHVGTVPGGQSLCVLLRYHPQPNTAPAVPSTADTAEAAATAAAEAPSAEAATGEGKSRDKVRSELPCLKLLLLLLLLGMDLGLGSWHLNSLAHQHRHLIVGNSLLSDAASWAIKPQ